MPDCQGFCFRGAVTDDAVEIVFKSKWDIRRGTNRWTSFRPMAGMSVYDFKCAGVSVAELVARGLGAEVYSTAPRPRNVS